jgi:HSP20 family molecular chaperone IbpA
MVKDASLSGGLLTIELERRVPEAMKPRHISIATGEENPNGSQRVA